MLAAGAAFAQEQQSPRAQAAVLTGGGKAVVCEGEPIKCPLKHDTCKKIDAPIVVGTGTYQSPDVGQLSNIHIFMCMSCGIIFGRDSNG